jgi:DNA-binding transcriptional ArsR family regulator
MVNRSEALDSVFMALADPTRRGMLAQLAQGRARIGDLGTAYDMTKGAVTKHVKVLERAGLLKRDVQGREHWCEIDTVPLDKASKWVAEVREFWEERLDDLAAYLDGVQGKKKKR